MIPAKEPWSSLGGKVQRKIRTYTVKEGNMSFFSLKGIHHFDGKNLTVLCRQISQCTAVNQRELAYWRPIKAFVAYSDVQVSNINSPYEYGLWRTTPAKNYDMWAQDF